MLLGYQTITKKRKEITKKSGRDQKILPPPRSHERGTKERLGLKYNITYPLRESHKRPN
jgi:hypothetical protein